MPQWISLPALVDYAKAIALMEQRVENVILAKEEEAVFLLEHLDVYTAGTSYNVQDLLDVKDIPIVYSGRGGKITYHGPGQRVIYPVLNLGNPGRVKDIKLYIRNLEQWVINSLGEIGVRAYTIDGMVGIWANYADKPAKIGAIGVRVKKWVTYHGIAINIATDISKFSGIIPCGISDFPVTSLKQLGIEISLEDFDFILKREFRKIF
ncbi:MAG: lipoyl(octanoyl) transferase LipB [Rickettsiaceae bacterium]